ncbi:MAG TPA: septal ring lytic transglycosylase RlpA family protein [Gammaproteobacteria bacterium]|nr:septal ring lytic transglycosylase RlpA family protein [Gammaproteobacteria bacterium]
MSANKIALTDAKLINSKGSLAYSVNNLMQRFNVKPHLFRYFLIGGSLLLLIGCGSTAPPPESANAGRYSIRQDRAPTRDVDIAAIPDVIPQPVNRTMAGNKSPYTVFGKTYYVMPSEDGYRETGVASWYGEKFHGHETSNGEVFDMYQSSAAHKALPIPSFLKVTNLDNNRSLVVRVNDRGPFHGDRIIDLSYAAALKLGYADRGTARVQLEAVVPTGSYRDVAASARDIRFNNVGAATGGSRAEVYLQVGAFADLQAAHRISNRLRQLTDRRVFIQSSNEATGGTLHRVRVGPVNDPGEIQQITERVVAANLGNPYSFT